MGRITSMTTRETSTRPVPQRPGRLSWADLWREFFALDCRAAQAAVGRPGTAGRVGPFQIWSETGSGFEKLVSEYEAGCRSELAGVIGGDPPAGPHRVFAFDTRRAFAAYHRAIRAYSLGPLACTSGWRRPRIAVCREATDRFPDTSREALALGLSYSLARSQIGRSAPAWLLHGLAFRTATRVAGSARAPGWPVRFLQAALFRGELSTAVELFDRVDELLTDGTEADGRTDGWLRFAAQSGSFAEFLAETASPKWNTFVGRLRQARDPLRECAAAFRRFPDDLVVDWVEWFRNRKPEPHTEPRPEVCDEIERLVRVIDDAAAPTTERLSALRQVARGGHAWGCRAVVQLVGAGHDVLAEAAVRTLEDISGERNGNTVAEWCNWVAGLPANAVGP